MLLTKLSFCQTGYPKLAVIGSDTVCEITITQLDSINAIIVDLDECSEIKDSLCSEIRTFRQLDGVQKETILSQEKEIQIQKNIVTEKDKIISIDDSVNKKLTRRAKWLKFQRNILTLAVLVLGGALIF